MRYLSTRADKSAFTSKSFCEIVLEGLAPDGGLYVPFEYPRIDQATLIEWGLLSYPQLALEIASRFIDDIAKVELQYLIDTTYTEKAFGSKEITPVQMLDSRFGLLRVSNGPTLAFKDIAMQWLGNLFEYVLARHGRSMNILGATSGDTGSSAEYAMRGKRNVKVFMLSPHGRMSPFQQAQMYSLNDPNIFNLAIEGTFDSCQDIVKTIGNDQQFKQQYQLGAVNSINWARVMAQVVYYFKGYLTVVKSVNEPLDIAVPTGNFGNILAAWVAKQMGLPLRRLILATNENDVLDDFFTTGCYRPRAAEQTYVTSSPSMDISKASNFERFIFDCTGRDPQLMSQLWGSLSARGYFDLADPEYTDVWARVIQSGFVSGASTHADRLATIRSIYQKYNTIIDPHTADGVKVGLQYCDPKVTLLCVETALPTKFAATIEEALSLTPPRPAAFDGLENRPKQFTVLPADAEAVKEFMRQHII